MKTYAGALISAFWTIFFNLSIDLSDKERVSNWEGFPSGSVLPKCPWLLGLDYAEARDQEFSVGIPSGCEPSSSAFPRFALAGSKHREQSQDPRPATAKGCRCPKWGLDHCAKCSSLNLYIHTFKMFAYLKEKEKENGKVKEDGGISLTADFLPKCPNSFPT